MRVRREVAGMVEVLSGYQAGPEEQIDLYIYIKMSLSRKIMYVCLI